MSEEFSIKKALEDVLSVYLELREQEKDLDRQKALIDQRKSKVLLKVISLANLSDDIPEDSLVGGIVKNAAKMGLTDAVRMVLKASGEALAATQVRDQLIRIGVNLSRFQNPIASITTVLMRINAAGEADIFYDDATDKWTFRWKSPETEDRFRSVPSHVASSVITQVAGELINERRVKPKKATKKKAGKKKK